MARFDVVVVGGGPAGSATAWALASSGAKVLVLEKASYPRDKPCGDGITPRAVRLLQEMGLEDELRRFQRIDRIRVSALGRAVDRVIPKRAGVPNYMYVVPRTALDQLLARRAEAAGAEIWEGSRVRSPIVEDGRVVGVEYTRGGKTEQLLASVVVAADGAPGALGRHLGMVANPGSSLALAVRAQVMSSRSDDPTIEVKCLPVKGGLLPGYGWVFPMGDGQINIGIGYGANYDGWRNLNSREIFRQFVESLPREWNLPLVDEIYRGGSLRGWRLPMGLSVWPPWRPGIVAVGDAAGVIKPTTGAGISKAIESGMIAAEVIVKALNADGPDSLGDYERRLHERWGRQYRQGARFLGLIARPRFLWILAQAALRQGPVQNRLERLLLKG